MFVEIGGQKKKKEKRRRNWNIKRQEAKQSSIWKHGSRPLLDLLQLLVKNLEVKWLYAGQCTPIKSILVEPALLGNDTSCSSQMLRKCWRNVYREQNAKPLMMSFLPEGSSWCREG